MAAYAALASLMNNIEQMNNHPLIISTSLDTNLIQILLEKAGSLLDFIEGYNHDGAAREEVEDLERRIARAAHAAEDAIESHIVDQIHAGSSEASLTCSIDLQRIIEDMDPFLRKANELKEKQGLIREEQPMHSRPLMETGVTTMVGFEDESYQLMDQLTSERPRRCIVLIVGMGGAGKTTLAKNGFENTFIKRHFDIRAWATISQQHDAREILSQLLSIQGDSSRGTVDDLGLQLHKTLSGRRYLIVLDDLWSVEAWDEVRHFFPDNGNRSRVIFTTRLSNVPRDSGSGSENCITMKPLNEHNNWKLFCNKAFELESCPYPELEKAGKNIMRLCKGLPLSTVVIGGLLLKSPMSLQFWENVVSNIKSNLSSKEKEESLDILALSYNHLPPRLKPCFLYMGVFKEDSVIRISELINLWVAEGFLRPKNNQILEEVAKGYLKELIDRNLISARKHYKNDGKLGFCGIHDLVRDLCLKVGAEQEFPRAPPIIRDPTSRLSPADRKLLRVRVVSDHVMFFPLHLYDCVNLRYIKLDFITIRPVLELPSSVSLKWNLQTLNISFDRSSWTHALVVAPIEIWRMQQLRHVKCSKIYLPSDGLPLMDKLQTLATAVNFRLSEHVCDMIPNIKKLHLLYQRSMHGYIDGMIECVSNVHRLHKLESLKLSIVGSSQLVIKSEVNKKLAFPSLLKKLCLSGCQLRWEDMRKIGSLPQLQVLELGISSVMVGRKWSLVDEQFVRLKFLKMEWCNLHCWEADSSNFPALEKLDLNGLRQLEEVPCGMGGIPSLELIHVEYCSESAAVSAVRIKEEQLENHGDDDLQVQLKIPVAEVESFKERVEAEGLTLDHVQLERLGRDGDR